MKAVILRCTPGGMFHFGRYAPDSDTALNETSDIIHSDTLFSGLVNIYADQYGNAEDFVSCFENESVSISSAFFCLQQGSTYVWFLPKPLSFNLAEVNDTKSFKKIRFISSGLWNAISSPQDIVGRNDVLVLQNSFALLNTEVTSIDEETRRRFRIYNPQNLPKVQVRKPTQEGSLYQLSVIEIADTSQLIADMQAHYYFLMNETVEHRMKNRLKVVIELLGSQGIGGERSTIGQFEGIEFQDNWAVPQGDSDSSCALSLCVPKDNEVPMCEYYDTLFRGGRRLGDRGAYLKSVRMMREGSVVKTSVRGRICDIKAPNYSGAPYLRYGKVFTIPMKRSWTV